MATTLDMLNAFQKKSIGELGANEQVLYMRLLMIWNELRRPDIFKVANSQLIRETGIRNRNALVSAKRRLVEKGYIQTVNFKTAMTRFRLVDISVDNTVDNSTSINMRQEEKPTCINTIQDKDGACINTIQDLYQIDTKLVSNPTPSYREKKSIEDDDRDTHITKIESAKKSEAVNLYIENVEPTAGGYVYEQLYDLLDTYGEEWLCEAVKATIEAGGRSVRYVTRTLENWRHYGFKADRKTRRRNGKGHQLSTLSLEDMEDEGMEALRKRGLI